MATTAYDITTLPSDLQKQITAGTPNIGDQYNLPAPYGGSIIKISPTGYAQGEGSYQVPTGGAIQFSTQPTTAAANLPKPLPSEGDIYQQKLSQAQGEISGIESYYQNLITQQETAHTGRQAQIDAMVAGGQIAGSAAKMGTTQKEAEYTAQQEQTIRDAQAKAIADIYQNVEANAQSAYQFETGNVEAQNKQIKSDAMDYLSKAAASGVTADMLAKDTELFGKLQQQTGMGAAELELYMNSLVPLKQKSDYLWQDGKAFQFDPKTGQMTPRPDLDTTTTGSSKVMNVGGTLLNLPIDAKGNVVLDPNKTIKDYIFQGTKEGQFKSTIKQIGVDEWGNPIYGEVGGGEVGGEGVAPAGGAKISEPSLYTDFTKNLTAEGKAAFDKLPNDTWKTNVIQLINGEALIDDVAKGMGGAKMAGPLNAAAKQVESSYDPRQNRIRYDFLHAWQMSTGDPYNFRFAANTGIGHLADLKILVDKLQGQSDFMKANQLKQWLAANINTPGIADIVAQMNKTILQLGGEMANIFVRGKADVETMRSQEESINTIQPKNVLNGVINISVQLIGDRASASIGEYKNVMGKMPTEPIIQSDVIIKLLKSGVDINPLLVVIGRQRGFSEDDVNQSIKDNTTESTMNFLYSQ